jgi:CRISPR/Cas system-associated endoribonuclease Cas2
MKDLTERLRKIQDDAEDCLLISRLATDQTKRQTFSRLATQLEQMAADLEAVIAAKRASGET